MKILPFKQKVKKWFRPKIKVGTFDPALYVNHKVKAKLKVDDTELVEIKIREIQGSIAHPKHFLINGTHFVGMLSFYTQMLEGRIPTAEEEAEFELATQITKIQENKNGKTAQKPGRDEGPTKPDGPSAA